MITIPGRVPIHIHPFFWGLAVFIGWMYTQTVLGTAVCVLVILLSLLIHECGHACTALFFGQNAQIFLLALGGLTVRQGRPLKRWQEFLVILNGPLAGFAAFGIGLALRQNLSNLPPLSALALAIFVFINLYWNFLNLLPLIPLDGGRLMSIVFDSLFGFRGVQAALILSILLSVGLSGLLLYGGASMGGILVLIFAAESLRELLGARRLSVADRDEELHRLYAQARTYLMQGNVRDAVPLLEAVRERSAEGMLFTQATVDLATLLASAKELERAYHLIHPLKDSLEGEALQLFHQLAFEMGEWREAIDSGVACHRALQHPMTAFHIAVSHARLGELSATLGWLHRAQSDGMQKLKAALERADFDAIRNEEAFRNFKQGLEE
ncbi:MAG: M50 family metallopeptidase [Chlamydiia bacterium]|nr:M50 family metallopeptidase [Chlamydiia bacterium]